MDGADATAAPLGAWASIRGYFTPATLFLVVNLVIGTIALTSRSHQRRRRGAYHHDDAHHQEPLHQLHHHPQQDENHYYQQPQQQYAPPPAPLARTSSVLDRLRSLGLYRFRSGDFPPEYTAAAQHHTQDVISPVDDETKQAHYARSRSEPAREKKAALRMKKSGSEVRKVEEARAPARVEQAAAVAEEEDVVYARADEFIHNFTPQQQELHYQEEYVPPPAPAPLARTPSILDRLRSFGLYRFRSGDLPPEYAAAPDATAEAADKKKEAAHYDRSRSEPAREQNKKGKKQAAAEARMTKSSSEARNAAAAPSTAEEEGVDARADDFINKFRQQLQLQRLNSLLNYKEMLNRGGKE